MARWEVVVHDLALGEVQWLKRRNPAAFNDVIEGFKRLAKSRDPRRCPNVKEIVHDAQGWFRLAIYEHNIRVVFRLMQEIEGEYVEILGFQPLDKDADNSYIEITRLAHRGEVYGRELKKRLDDILGQ